LVGNLEREAIELAHVWPKTYPSLEEGREKSCCYWFVGLVIKASSAEGTQNLDLTTPIKKFTELVMGTAITIKRWKEGMRVEAYYKKRKQLAPYLPPAERHKLKTERKSAVSALAAALASSTSTASNSPARKPSIEANEPVVASKRRPLDEDEMSAGSNGTILDGGADEGELSTDPPPMKRSNTADSEISKELQVS
jgi:hypothetical protein